MICKHLDTFHDLTSAWSRSLSMTSFRTGRPDAVLSFHDLIVVFVIRSISRIDCPFSPIRNPAAR